MATNLDCRPGASVYFSPTTVVFMRFPLFGDLCIPSLIFNDSVGFYIVVVQILYIVKKLSKDNITISNCRLKLQNRVLMKNLKFPSDAAWIETVCFDRTSPRNFTNRPRLISHRKSVANYNNC